MSEYMNAKYRMDQMGQGTKYWTKRFGYDTKQSINVKAFCRVIYASYSFYWQYHFMVMRSCESCWEEK